MAGLWYEEFEIGKEYKHEWSRTVTEYDNILFTSITMNPAPIHLDAEYMKTQPHGQRLMNSLYTAGLVGGMIVHDLTMGTTLGNLGYTKFDFPNPVFHGDTIRVETEVKSVRESRSRPDAGIVEFEHRGYNQRDELVCTCIRSAFMRRQPAQG